MSVTHLAIFALSLVGFAALAIGTERYSAQLIGFLPAESARRTSWWLGWLLLAGAVLLAVLGLQTAGAGMALWFGWLSLAGVALAFALPDLPWQRREAAKPARAPRGRATASDPGPVRRPRHWIGWSLLTATVAVFLALLSRVETKPLLREDAVQGRVGPWSFTFAETDRDPPELVDMEVPRKIYSLRFCDTCDLEIARAYLKVNKPRALRASGMVFEGKVQDRRAEVQLPANLTAESELWLTVVGKDGSVHQTSWPIKAISPVTVAWFEKQGNNR